jgi:hypothetical protein
MTQAESAFGTLLKIGDGATPTEGFTTIAEVKDITGPNLAQQNAEVTSHDSTDGWIERIGTLLDGGQVTFEVNFVPTHATHSFTAGLIKDMVNRTKRNFKLVFTDGGATTWLLPALVSNVAPGNPVNGPRSAAITLTAAGKPTLAG